MTLALLLIVSLPPQDDVSDLILKLGNDSIEIREAAIARLLKIGEPARAPLVKASESASKEVRVRIAAVLKSLDFQKEMREWLGAPARVSLAGEMSLEEAMREFERQTGQKVACAHWPTGRFKVDIKEANAWTALNDLCRASGARTLQLGSQGPRLAGNRFVDVPTGIQGSFCIRFDSLAFYRTFQVDSNSETSSLVLALMVGWGRATAPTKMALALERVEDDLGNDLAPGFRRREERTMSGSPLVVAEPKPEFGRALHLSTDELPDPKAARIARLSGRVLIWVRASADDLEFDLPGEKEQAHLDVSFCDTRLEEISVMDVTLSAVAKRGTTLHGDLGFEGGDAQLLKDTFQLWHLNDTKGRKYVGVVRSRTRKDTARGFQGYSIEFQNLPADAELKSITVRLPRKIVALDLPFELKNIPLK